MFKGIFTANITPFKNGSVDTSAYKILIQRQKDTGIDGIVVGGCTGESFTLSMEDNLALWETAMAFQSKSFKIILGTGSNATDKAIMQSKKAEEFKPDGLLVITPFANKPNQDGIYHYYKDISESVNTPIIVYNVPSRTASNVSVETLKKLAQLKGIVAIKQAVSEFDEFTKIRLHVPEIELLSGEDSLTYPMLTIGGHGLIGTSSNAIPGLWVDLFKNFHNGNVKKAEEIHCLIYPFIKSLFLEGNPAPLKHAMQLLGLSNGELRKPLYPVSQTTEDAVKKELTALKMLK